MKVIVSESSPSQRTLEVVLEQERVENAYQKAFGRAAKGLALPGFRRGKVPLHLAKKYITDDGLTSHVLEDLVPHAYHEALAQEKLRPISEPRWDIVQRERGKDLIFKVSFEIKPVFEVKDYKGIELRHEKPELEADAVEKTLENLRGQQARVVPAPEGHALAELDLAVVDYHSTEIESGEEVAGGSADKYLMELRQENFIPGFVDNLVGLKAGDDKEFDIVFPDDYPNPGLAGKNVHFKFHVHETKLRQLPDLDDDFAKALSSHDTLAELKDDIQQRMEAQIDRRLREQVAVKMIDKLLPQIPAESVPQAMHQYRTRMELQRRLGELERAGVSMERYLEDRKISREKWMMELSVLGQLEARVEIMMENLARQEGLEVTQDELDLIISNEAHQRGQSAAELRAQVERDGTIEMVRYSLLRAKVMDMLFDNGKLEYVPVGTLAAEAEAAPAAEKPEKAEKAEKAADKPAAEKESKPKAKAKKATAEKEEAAPKNEEAVEEEPKPAKAKRATKKKEA